MKRIKQLCAALLLALTVGLSAAPALPVYADSSTDAACNAISDNKGCTSTGPSIDTIIKTVINLLSLVVGVVAVIMIIVSGFRYVTAGGDSNKIKAAKDTLVYSIIGLVIAALAQTIVHFVLAKVG